MMPPQRTPTRITSACNGCRNKKQKCSGDREGCAQCRASGQICTWPTEKKRGPAKGYIEALENRLLETERLLLQLLPTVSSEHLGSICYPDGQSPSKLAQPNTPSISPGLTFPKKVGIEYWTSYPLATVSEVRRWQEDRFRDCGIKIEEQAPNGHKSTVGATPFTPYSTNLVASHMNRPGSHHGMSSEQSIRDARPSFDPEMLPSPALDPRKAIAHRASWSQAHETQENPASSTLKDPQLEPPDSGPAHSSPETPSYSQESIMPAKFQREFLW